MKSILPEVNASAKTDGGVQNCADSPAAGFFRTARKDDIDRRMARVASLEIESTKHR
jgi:hypothetical protein